MISVILPLCRLTEVFILSIFMKAVLLSVKSHVLPHAVNPEQGILGHFVFLIKSLFHFCPKVSLLADYSVCRIYWRTSLSSDKDVQIQQVLDKCSPRIRYIFFIYMFVLYYWTYSYVMKQEWGEVCCMFQIPPHFTADLGQRSSVSFCKR